MFRIRFPECWVGRGHCRMVEMAVVGEPERESIHLLPEEVPGSWSSTQWGVLAIKGLAGSVRGCCLRTGSGGAARSSASSALPHTKHCSGLCILNKVDMSCCPGTSAQWLRQGSHRNRLPDSGWGTEEETWLLQHEAHGEQLGYHLGEEPPSEPAVVET